MQTDKKRYKTKYLQFYFVRIHLCAWKFNKILWKIFCILDRIFLFYTFESSAKMSQSLFYLLLIYVFFNCIKFKSNDWVNLQVGIHTLFNLWMENCFWENACSGWISTGIANAVWLFGFRINTNAHLHSLRLRFFTSDQTDQTIATSFWSFYQLEFYAIFLSRQQQGWAVNGILWTET